MTKTTQYIGYKITHKDSGRYYIGAIKAYWWDKPQSANLHKTRGELPATPYYMGSGTAIREAILEHGADAFEREILARFYNEKDAFAWERDNVIMQDQDPLSYNIQGGGKKGFKVAESTRDKMKTGNTGHFKYGKEHPNYGKCGADNHKYIHGLERYPNGRIKQKKRKSLKKNDI